MSVIGSQLANAPFVRLLLPLCAGVCIPVGICGFPPFFAMVGILLVLIVLLMFRTMNFTWQHVWGTILLITIFFFGIYRSGEQIRIYPILPDQQYFGILDDYPSEREKTYMVTAQLIGVRQKVLIFLPKTSDLKSAPPGDIIVFNGKPDLVTNDGNPFEFDYQNYLLKRNIGYRIFLKERNVRLLTGIHLQTIFHKALIFRAKLMERLDRAGINGGHVHLIGSISFGARDEVDKEVIQSFTNTGVIHVLAVSGMNVGLIFVILNLIFSFLKFNSTGHFFYTLIILSGIWSYTLITGMSASILRAALMFSFIILGRLFGRDSNIFNSLAVSAFVLIVWDPNLINDVGFQLSYMAVLSIVVIHPLILKQLYFDNWFLRQIWILISITCSAQLGTIPFTLIYFHQFPVYFWLANLLVIPLVSVILYLSFLVVFIGLISPHAAMIVAIFLDWSVKVVLLTVKIVGDLPFSVIKGLYPTLFQISLVFIGSGLLVAFLHSRLVKYLYGALFTFSIFWCTIGYVKFRQLSRAEIIFYNIPGTRAVILANRREAVVLYDKCEQAASKLGYYMNPYFGERGLRKIELFQLSDSLCVRKSFLSIDGFFVIFKGVRIYVEPQKGESHRIISPVYKMDVTWIASRKMGAIEKIGSHSSRFVLFRPQESSGKVLSPVNGQTWMEMSKAVQMIIEPGKDGLGNKRDCLYFN